MVLALSIFWARYHEIHPAEMRVFRAVNGLPDWLYRLLWLPMQLGNLVVGTRRRPARRARPGGDLGIAVGVVLAMVAEARGRARSCVARWRTTSPCGSGRARARPAPSSAATSRRRAQLPVRARHPGRRHRRASWPSASTGVVGGSRSSLTALVMLGRVYVGAHNPLDVTAGLGAGLIIGAGLLFVVAWL